MVYILPRQPLQDAESGADDPRKLFSTKELTNDIESRNMNKRE